MLMGVVNQLIAGVGHSVEHVISGCFVCFPQPLPFCSTVHTAKSYIFSPCGRGLSEVDSGLWPCLVVMTGEYYGIKTHVISGGIC